MRVTIEGVVNSDVIQRGERCTVEWTDRLAALRKNGLIQVVDWHPDDVQVVNATGEQVDVIIEHDTPEPPEPVKEATPEDLGLDEPPRSATKAVWKKFAQEAGVPVFSDDTKTAIQDRYDDWRANQDG
ncbi:hypothetical protein [Rhodococcus koreensis]